MWWLLLEAYLFAWGRLYKTVNNTLVTIIPKSNFACIVKDFRTISCCTIVYKLISKVMANRLGKIIGSMEDASQTAFIPGQHIHDHTILTYQLIKGYSAKSGFPRCIIQMDIQKMYDSVEWSALKDILIELSFPKKFIIIMRSISYRYKVNNSITRNILAKSGLRQGDPLSHFLFVLVMEYLHRVLRKIARNLDFNFHSKCEKLKIINLIFADDLLLFSRGDIVFVHLVMQVFSSFFESTRLYMNPAKCNVYFGNVSNVVSRKFRVSHLLRRDPYLLSIFVCLLLVKKLYVNNCLMIVEKMVNRIRHWSSRMLNFVGRTHLIRSTLFVISNY